MCASEITVVSLKRTPGRDVLQGALVRRGVFEAASSTTLGLFRREAGSTHSGSGVYRRGMYYAGEKEDLRIPFSVGKKGFVRMLSLPGRRWRDDPFPLRCTYRCLSRGRNIYQPHCRAPPEARGEKVWKRYFAPLSSSRFTRATRESEGCIIVAPGYRALMGGRSEK